MPTANLCTTLVLQKKKNTGGENKENEDNITTVILKVDMHCDGCASKMVKYLRDFQGLLPKSPLFSIFTAFYGSISDVVYTLYRYLRFHRDFNVDSVIF